MPLCHDNVSATRIYGRRKTRLEDSPIYRVINYSLYTLRAIGNCSPSFIIHEADVRPITLRSLPFPISSIYSRYVLIRSCLVLLS